MSFNSGINKVFLIGHIVKDSRSHNDQVEKQSNIHFSIVTEETLMRNGAETLHQELHNVIVPGKLANGGEQFVKDRMIYIEGSVKTKTLIDGDGIKRYKTEIWVNAYKLLT